MGCEAVRAAGALDRSLFVTGNVAALRQLRALSPEARIGLTWVDGPEPPLALLDELGAEFWNPMFGFVYRRGGCPGARGGPAGLDLDRRRRPRT